MIVKGIILAVALAVAAHVPVHAQAGPATLSTSLLMVVAGLIALVMVAAILLLVNLLIRELRPAFAPVHFAHPARHHNPGRHRR